MIANKKWTESNSHGVILNSIPMGALSDWEEPQIASQDS